MTKVAQGFQNRQNGKNSSCNACCWWGRAVTQMGTGPGQAGREAGTVDYRSIDQPGTRPRALPPGLPPRLKVRSRFLISKYRIGTPLSLRDSL
jgi:hypothetical protein